MDSPNVKLFVDGSRVSNQFVICCTDDRHTSALYTLSHAWWPHHAPAVTAAIAAIAAMAKLLQLTFLGLVRITSRIRGPLLHVPSGFHPRTFADPRLQAGALVLHPDTLQMRERVQVREHITEQVCGQKIIQ